MLVRFMFYFIFVARMSCFCPFATISFRTSCHVCSDGMKNHFCMPLRAWKVLYQVNVLC
ncbi:unknown [Prevotella sp. CAG:487]|nr:unknown [Prevotella sp. CAG:487]